MTDYIKREDALRAFNGSCSTVDADDILRYLHKSIDVIENIPSADVVEVVRCKDCIHYDPPHIENHGERYEYKDMPKDAFDKLGTGLVHVGYGVNIGGRCTKNYNVGYAYDKRVYVSANSFCSYGERAEE